MVSKKSTKKSKSGRNKSTTRVQVHQPDQVDAVPAAPSVDINPAPAVGTKNVWELKIDELRKECVKLGLLDTNTKDKKERCLTLLTEYLSKRGISMGTFKFASNGETVYADVLLGAPANGTPITTDESDSESSDSETESDEEARKKQSKAARRLAKNTRFNSVSFSDVSSSASSTSNKSPNMLPPGWQVLPNQVTGEPVALLDPAGKLHAVGSSAMVNNSPQSVTSTAEDTTRSISTAAALLRGMGETETASMSTARTVNPAPANKFNPENLDFCGVSVPGSLYITEKENSTKKIVSGKFSTGKKEVRQKILWPQMAVDSTIRPSGVEYDDMDWQELTNGFTAMILAECNQTNVPERVHGMLQHLNRISAYGMFAPIETVLEFNAGYMMGIENMSQSWDNLKKMKEFHDRNLHSLKLGSHITKEKITKKSDNIEKDNTDS